MDSDSSSSRGRMIKEIRLIFPDDEKEFERAERVRLYWAFRHICDNMGAHGMECKKVFR